MEPCLRKVQDTALMIFLLLASAVSSSILLPRDLVLSLMTDGRLSSSPTVFVGIVFSGSFPLAPQFVLLQTLDGKSAHSSSIPA